MIEGMRVLITGGHGFIGTVLTRELLARGSLGGRPVGTLLLADRVAAPMAGHDRTLPGDPDPDPDPDADADADARSNPGCCQRCFGHRPRGRRCLGALAGS